ncbi:hypothetical protein [Sulfolobus acidocaldarius]|uniref:Uncharacterized protein n=5 Tax=Sulfolobus acidocaldarius TaxID=2285 RepID=Q4J7R0_SULAC|nr:hypothetical protein [Sulfolobus acidocaldarius]AAY81172.1 hypothetical protein Saci_1866 [Sulfolobus acidocaldarius DSM 639]AGE71786.1 hypothetical protein SacN8_09130 [Sulfolobus acidocaldarius N8]AGE74058.1 hypothetical protein SacRon12I_09155 [Sulfolobus acidocaldarius Ron12/I]ALU30018.1 hypothetical protein ATY89_08775 [Sulfolobus acidocaldarius]ALU30708.1 hypothetical protein ATZ20_00185 [Sulfolobus acidocaldarius]
MGEGKEEKVIYAMEIKKNKFPGYRYKLIATTERVIKRDLKRNYEENIGYNEIGYLKIHKRRSLPYIIVGSILLSIGLVYFGVYIALLLAMNNVPPFNNVNILSLANSGPFTYTTNSRIGPVDNAIAQHYITPYLTFGNLFILMTVLWFIAGLFIYQGISGLRYGLKKRTRLEIGGRRNINSSFVYWRFEVVEGSKVLENFAEIVKKKVDEFKNQVNPGT